MYGWYSRKQAKLAGTVIYLDEEGNEVELSSVSEGEDGRPEFDDVRLVTMVRADGFVRRVSDGSPYASSFDDFDPYASSLDELNLYARLLVINRQAQLQNTAHPPQNQLTLVNASGTDALAWLVGPLEWAPLLEDKESTTVHVPAGRYYTKLRYGTKEPHLYFKGEEFNIIEGVGYASSNTIVLPHTTDESYRIYPISESEFVAGLNKSVEASPTKASQSTEKTERTRCGAKTMPFTPAGHNIPSAPHASSRKAIDEWRRRTGTFASGAPIGKKDIKKMAEAILRSMDYDPGGVHPPADCAASALLELTESHMSDLKEANIQKSLVRSLGHGDRLVRNTVAKVLNTLGWTPKRDADKVAYFIATEEWDALSKMGKSAVKLLCGWVRTSESDLYVNVARVLGDIGDARAIKDLSYCHCDDYSPTMVAPAAEALAKIGKRHFEKLVGALKDTRIMDGATAIWALCEIGDRRATAAVIDWILEYGTGADMEVTMTFGNKPPSPPDLMRMMIPPQILPNLLGDYTDLILDIFDWKPTSDPEKFDLSRCKAAVGRLCMLRTPVSNNVLSKVAKMRELAVTHTMLYSDHILKYIAADELRQMAKEELRRRGKPRYDPSVYLNPDAWRI